MINIFIICLVFLIVNGQQETEPEKETPCFMEGGGLGICVHYTLCDVNTETIITDGTFIVDARFGEKNENDECPRRLEICCRIKSKTLPVRETPKSVKPRGCGRRNENGISTNNKDHAKFGEFPWTVAIMRNITIQRDTVKVFQCGGVLIHPRVVLTAAKCVTNSTAKNKNLINGLTVRIGEWVRHVQTEPIPYQDRYIKSIDRHKNYRYGFSNYNVAILILQSSVELSDSVDLICLPKQASYPKIGECFLSGWGASNSENTALYHNVMKKLNITILEKNECLTDIKKIKIERNFTLHNSVICARGEPGKNACDGDNGSPLVCPMESRPGQYELAGMYSRGYLCGDYGTPSLYANIPYLISWIKSTLLENDINDLDEVNSI